jgi:molybdate transport system substrate-binding protein
MLSQSFAAIAACVTGLALVPMAELRAQTPPLRVLVSNGMKAAVEDLRSQAEREIGRPLELKFNSTAGIRQQIQAGEAFDVTVITSEAIGELIRQGKLGAASRSEIARSELGIGIRAGAPKPDIKSPDALKRALRAAASITFPKDGASRGYIEGMFEKLRIAADVKPKIILAEGSAAATESVAAGKATMVITLFSEIVPIKGVEILGPLPAEYHYDIRFAAAASSTTKNAEAAKKLIAFLAGPAPLKVFKAKGLERK